MKTWSKICNQDKIYNRAREGLKRFYDELEEGIRPLDWKPNYFEIKETVEKPCMGIAITEEGFIVEEQKW